MTVDNRLRIMRGALRLARRGWGLVEPNPMVGCIIAAPDGTILGQGWHRRFGGPHAEIEALADCQRRGNSAAGADVFVTLEPCCHHGKTAPCTAALIEAKIDRVFVAMKDPYHEVSGQGMAQLQEAGIAVETGVAEAEARRLNEAYLKRIETGLPWVIAKWAQTLDGRIAAAGGDSRWISNEVSRKWVHRVRARVDAVMIGIGTAATDNPMLTARDVRIRRRARRVVVDPQLRICESSKLVTPADRDLPISPPVTLGVAMRVMEEQADKVRLLRDRGVEVVPLPELEGAQGVMDLRPLLAHLTQAHCATNVLVEGGSGLLGHLFRQGLVDQVLAFVAPKLLGDERGLASMRGFTRETIADATPLNLHRIKRLAGDVVLDYRVG